MTDSFEPQAIAEDELVLHVGGESVTGWEEIMLSRALDQVAGAFSISLPASQVRARRGDPVELTIGGDLVLTGFVEVRRVRDDGSTRLTLAGRGATGDLVDCSPKLTPVEWKNVYVQEVIETLIDPFDIDLEIAHLDDSGARFDKFAVQPGETVWAAIERACRLRGLLCYELPDGALRLTKPGIARAVVDLVQGQNVESIDAEENDADRFSIYYTLGHTPAALGGWGAPSDPIKGVAQDEGMHRYRPLVVIGEGPMTFEGAADRARWEAQMRAARADRIAVVSQGFRQGTSGPPWELNLLVGVRYPRLSIDAERLVNALRFTRGAQGTLTELELVRADAYAAAPVVEQHESDWVTHDANDEADTNLDRDEP